MRDIPEWAQLYLEWTALDHLDGAIKLSRPLFYGPVLKQAQRVQENDSMRLDFSEQNLILIPDSSFNVATLKWAQVNYLRDDVIELKDCVIEYNKIGLLRELTKDHFLIIDCTLHQEHIHYKNLTYSCWVLDNDGNPLGLI